MSRAHLDRFCDAVALRVGPSVTVERGESAAIVRRGSVAAIVRPWVGRDRRISIHEVDLTYALRTAASQLGRDAMRYRREFHDDAAALLDALREASR